METLASLSGAEFWEESLLDEQIARSNPDGQEHFYKLFLTDVFLYVHKYMATYELQHFDDR